jgi:hypothetical protein
MKKIPVLFVREFHGPGHLFDRAKNAFTITEQVTPGCEWVLAGEGVATRQWDGTAVLVKEGRLYARFDAKNGKPPPAGAIPCVEAPDSVAGHWPHWVLADGPQHKWIREAFAACASAFAGAVADGTYEAIGPSINGGADGLPTHTLMRHGNLVANDAPRAFASLREWLARMHWEGIVFHHPDGRMAKIRRDDFGLPWPVKEHA